MSCATYYIQIRTDVKPGSMRYKGFSCGEEEGGKILPIRSMMASCAFQEPFLSCSRKETVLTLQRKPTRGGFPLTPRAERQPEGGTKIAAIASTRSCWPRIPLPLNCISDEDRTPHEIAARCVESFGSSGTPTPTSTTLLRRAACMEDVYSACCTPQRQRTLKRPRHANIRTAANMVLTAGCHL